VQHSVRQTLLFAFGLCVVCSVVVSGVSVGLRDRQLENRLLDRQKNVLEVAGLLEKGERITRAEIRRRFEENLEARVVELGTGEPAEGADPAGFDQRGASRNPETSRRAPPNPAKVRRVPNEALIYLIRSEGEVEGIILPIEGMGLWSVLYGYLALAADARTIRGITFYEHAETAGLGGEVDNPRWKALWPGRLAFDEQWLPRIAVTKGAAGPPDEDPHRVDGLSGSTLTSNGVTHMLRFWLGDHGFGPTLARYRASRTREGKP
jgi:Na+-transporting NADH:ubiquinone oxidoreductase subunit C